MTPRGVTVVLSGGGAKAAAHVGAVRALTESNMKPLRFVATSMGAIIGAALAAGIPENELLTRLEEVGGRGISRDPVAVFRGLFARSLLRPAPFRRAIESLLEARRFSDLAVPLTVTVTDLDTGELLLYGAGAREAPLVDVLVASCALPFYFPAAQLDGRRCGDGGLRGVLPLEVAAHSGIEPVIAVDVGPGLEVAAGKAPDTGPALVRAHDEAVGTLMASHTSEQLSRWRAEASRPPLTYVRPAIERYATFRVERMREYAEQGYRATRETIARSSSRT